MSSKYLLREWTHRKTRLRHFFWFSLIYNQNSFGLCRLYGWFGGDGGSLCLSDTPLFALHSVLFKSLCATSLWSTPTQIHPVEEQCPLSLAPTPKLSTELTFLYTHLSMFPLLYRVCPPRPHSPHICWGNRAADGLYFPHTSLRRQNYLQFVLV